MTPTPEISVEEVGARVEQLIDRLGGLDPAAARLAEDLVRNLLQLYGAGLVTILERLYEVDPSAIRELADDTLVGGLMALHDLHPVPVEERIEAALDECRPYMESHGGDVTLIGMDSGVVRLRLEGTCDGCGASELTLQNTVEQAVLAAAPEVASIEVDGLVPLGQGHAPPPDVQMPAGVSQRTPLPMYGMAR